MEEKKNNAVEKAEKVMRENESETVVTQETIEPVAPFTPIGADPLVGGIGFSGVNGGSGMNGVNGNINNGNVVVPLVENEKTVDVADLTSAEADEVMANARAENESLKAKQDKERRLAERRVELARIKAHKRAEKDKVKASAKRERTRKKMEYKQKKQELKAERKLKKQSIIAQNDKMRAERLAMQKARDAERKENKAKRRAELKTEKLASVERRAERRDRQKSKGGKNGNGGWLAAVISLGVATLILSSVLTFVLLMPTATDQALEASYQKSFYDTVEQVDNIDLNLSKVLATSDTEAMQKYLVNTAINSELAENDLQQLPLQDESKYYTTKLINQIGDYSKYLNNKLISGERLSDSDIESLTALYKANRTFKDSLQNMMEKMGSDYSFSTMMDGGNGNLIISNFNELQNLSVEYPELIYDGPFSDGLNNREVKGLDGEEISKERASDIFAKIFGRFGIQNVENVGETTAIIPCYNIQATVDGDLLYAQISKKGGHLIMFDYAGNCNGVNHDRATAIETAENFLQTVDVTDMKPVWINLANNVYTINFAYETQGVIVYSDLVKVRVCADTNTVLGYEASGYYINHTDRLIGEPVLSKNTAISKVSSNIDVETSRLALVPIGTSTEKLCYEFSGEYDGSTYYVYIDAITGKQVEMFKVIESTEGELLM